MPNPKHHLTTASETLGKQVSSITDEILRLEKETAQDSLRLARRKFEREREKWQKILESKEQEIISLKNRLELMEEKLKNHRARLEEERASMIDTIKKRTAEEETQKQNAARRWALVEEELKKYRSESESSRSALLKLREEFTAYRQKMSTEIAHLKDEIATRDSEILTLREKLLQAEQTYLKEKHDYQEKVSALEEKARRLEKELADEKLHREKLTAKTSEEINNLKNSLMEKIQTITSLEESRLAEERRRIETEQHLHIAEENLEKLKKDHTAELDKFARQIETLRADLENERIQAVSILENKLRESENRASKLSETVASLEKDLSEERERRKNFEAKVEQLKASLQEKTVSEGELKHRIYTLELERNSEIKRHDDEIASKEREIARLVSMLERSRLGYNYPNDSANKDNNYRNTSHKETKKSSGDK